MYHIRFTGAEHFEGIMPSLNFERLEQLMNLVWGLKDFSRILNKPFHCVNNTSGGHDSSWLQHVYTGASFLSTGFTATAETTIQYNRIHNAVISKNQNNICPVCQMLLTSPHKQRAELALATNYQLITNGKETSTML